MREKKLKWIASITGVCGFDEKERLVADIKLSAGQWLIEVCSEAKTKEEAQTWAEKALELKL